MSLATFSERVLNGEPIKWADWAELKNITPAQAAKLANRIDPIGWPENKCELGEIPKDIQILIRRIEQQLSDKKQNFTLKELHDFLGDEAPVGLIEQVSSKNINITPNKYMPRAGGYKERDEFAIKLVKDRPELLDKRAGEIKAELLKASNIFIVGIADWWRDNPIFPKSAPGRNPKKIIK